MTVIRIMQQIQSIDRESRDQPNFSRCIIRMWKALARQATQSR
jgi:hypothetical protein